MKKSNSKDLAKTFFCDMHVHSSLSDGKLDVQDLISLSEKIGLNEIIITDHDSIDAYKNYSNMLSLSGMEITCSYEPEIHILAYGFNINDININNYCDSFKKNQYLRTITLLKRLSIDYDIDFLELFKNNNISMEKIYKYMVSTGLYENSSFAKESIMEKYREHFIKKPTITAIDAINLIRNASGYTSIAHINRINSDNSKLEKLIAKLKSYGLDAIEIYNSCYSRTEIKNVLGLSQKFDLKLTGGSDFHGSFKNYIMKKIPCTIEENRIFTNKDIYINT